MRWATALARERPALMGAAWLFLAVNIANALGYAYQGVMVRLLSAADFAILVSLFAALIIEAQGMQLLQSAAAKIVADRRAVGDLAGVAAFARSWGSRIAFFIAFPSFALGAAGVPTAAALGLHPITAAMLGGSLFFAGLFSFLAGLLQGLGRFAWLGVLLISQAGARLVIGVMLVLAGFGVVGAFGAAAAAIALVVFAGLLPLQRVLTRHTTGVRPPKVGRFFFGSAAVLLSYAALVNADALLAPLLLAPNDAGAYAAAVTMGKVALFAPLGLSLFLLERTATAHALGEPTRPLLYRMLAAVLAVSGAVALAYVLAPELATRVIAGERYVGTASALAGIYGVVALSNALLNVWIAYFVGVGRLRVGILYASALLLMVAVLTLTARDSLTMARIVLAGTLAAQFSTVALFVRSPR